MLIYGEYNPIEGPKEVRILGGILPLAPTLAYTKSAASKFTWGYGGTGPRQLAFAILLHFLGGETAQIYHSAFEHDVLMHTDYHNHLFLDSEDVKTYIEFKKAQKSKWGRIYWNNYASRRRFSSSFYFKFIMPLEFGRREPAEPRDPDDIWWW